MSDVGLFAPEPDKPQVLVVTDSTGYSQAAGSINEYNTAQALHYFKRRFEYQVSFFGGHWMPGGQVLDFLAEGYPEVPIYCEGAYWHGGIRAMPSAMRIEMFNYLTNGEYAKPVVLKETETMTLEQAIDAVDKHYIRGI